jgi:hypothetical protein
VKDKAGVFVTGIAVGAIALAGVQWLDRMLETRKAAPAAATASNAKPAAKEQSGVLLMPGEQLVLAPEPPATQIPKPAPPQAAIEPPKPVTPPAPAAQRPARVRAPVVAQESSRPAPPQYSREERRDSFARSVCLNCGVVTSVTRGDYDWEVRVRLDDGTRRTMRYYDRPRVQVGDTFHIEDGRIVAD